jgi:RNA polymerase sigma factor (sigma-70 family)
VELTQDKINLIERIVKNNRKFAGNEDLYDDFFNETCKRSLVIIKAVDSDRALESYLRKIATTSIISVLKDSGRLRRSSGGYVATKEVVVDNFEIQDYPKISYKDVTIKNIPEDFAIKKEILNKVNRTVGIIHENTPEKQYLELFNMRYAQHMPQKEIADALGISQSEVSKRLMSLMDSVKQAFN